MKTFNITLTVSLFLVGLFGSEVTAKSNDDARHMGTAGASIVMARNSDAPFYNPANLGLPRANKWGFTLFSLSATASNSSFSKNDYDKYNGAYLSETDKNDILDKITGEGLTVTSSTSAQVLSVVYKTFALTFTGTGGARVVAPRDVIDLALNGNLEGREYSADNAAGHGLGTVAIGFSGALPLSINRFKASAVGATIKYHYGIGYSELTKTDISTITQNNQSTAEGLAEVIVGAPGGSGISFDLGFAADINDRWCVSLAWSDVVSTISFRGDSEKRLYSFFVDSLTVMSFEDEDVDSVFNYEELVDEGYSFTTHIPSELRIGGGYRLEKLTIMATYSQGFSRTGTVSSKPSFAAGVEYRPWKLLHLRTGLGIGGVNGFCSAWGLSFNPGPVRLDLAFQNIGGLLPAQSRGMAAGVGLRFEW